MDHVDIAGTGELTAEPLVALTVRTPFATDSGSCGSGGLSPRLRASASSATLGSGGGGGGTGGVKSIAKPSLPRVTSIVPTERWIPDSTVNACMAPECRHPFGFFVRKHHCRACGRIFCNNCSAHVMPMVDPAALAAAGLSPSMGPSPSPKGGGGSSGMMSAAALNSDSLPLITARLCSECFYEHQLVVPRRRGNGEPRRRCRGELKLLTSAVVVHVLTFLPQRDLLAASLVSSDLYFLSRDNAIWFEHNIARWVKDASILGSSEAAAAAAAANGSPSAAASSSGFASSGSGAAAAAAASVNRAVISMHSRYNFTQFIDYTRRLEAARCQGLSSFSSAAKQLLSNPIKICVVGPPSVGKTTMVRRWVNDSTAPDAAFPHPTCGFSVYTKRVALVGGLTSETTLQIIDVAGGTRYEAVRALCARGCHAVVLCYSAHSKLSLVQAADAMNALEESLGPQPVVVCGLVADASRRREVTEGDAEGVSVRCKASLQAHVSGMSLPIFESVVQAVLDRLVLGTAGVTSSSSPSTVAAPGALPSTGAAGGRQTQSHRTAAQELLYITTNPSVIDVLLEAK